MGRRTGRNEITEKGENEEKMKREEKKAKKKEKGLNDNLEKNKTVSKFISPVNHVFWANSTIP